VRRDEAAGVAEVGPMVGLERIAAAPLLAFRLIRRAHAAASAAMVADSSRAACSSNRQASADSGPSSVAAARARWMSW